MIRIRKVADATTAVNRAAIEAAQKIMREQFSAMPDYDTAKLPEQLANPLKHRFVSRLFVAENARDQTLGLALLLHAPDIGFSYPGLLSTPLCPPRGGAEPAPGRHRDAGAGDAARLKFYDRWGARRCRRKSRGWGWARNRPADFRNR